MFGIFFLSGILHPAISASEKAKAPSKNGINGKGRCLKENLKNKTKVNYQLQDFA